MKLHQLQNVKGAKHRTKRLGCGVGSGRGKTAGKGHKGQKARSGGSIRIGFEGGQIPLYRKLPHRGFNNANFTVRYAVVNVGDIDALEAQNIDRNELVKAGIIRESENLIKVLSVGEITSAKTVTANKFSAAAKAKIEQAGGKCVEIVKEIAPQTEEK